jgi:hypothetical protein
VEHSFDVVAVRVERERNVVAAADSGRTLAAPLSVPPLSIAAVPALDADGIRRPERDVCARRDAVSTWLCSDRVFGE